MNTEHHRPEGERRRAPRQKSLLSGRILYNNRRNAVDCLIRDISPYGARLVFSDAVMLPNVLELFIPHKDQTLRVHVIWSNGGEVGVAFPQASEQSNAAGTASADPMAERVQRLEEEVAALKRILKRLKTEIDHDDAA